MAVNPSRPVSVPLSPQAIQTQAKKAKSVSDQAQQQVSTAMQFLQMQARCLLRPMQVVASDARWVGALRRDVHPR